MKRALGISKAINRWLDPSFDGEGSIWIKFRSEGDGCGGAPVGPGDGRVCRSGIVAAGKGTRFAK